MSDTMSGTIEKYLIKIRKATSKPGIYAYRGQAGSQWPLHSAATRRLIKDHGSDEILRTGFSNVYRKYHCESLVEPARARGFDVEDGRKVSDLQLLAKLQHFRAATGLLDFTWSPLVALSFAIEDPKCNGKLFIIKTDDTLNVALISSDEKEQRLEAIFSPADNSPRLSYWEPTVSGDAMSRILRQRSVFIIGRPLIPEDTEITREIEIAEDDKAGLLKDLALLDVSQRSLFQDIYGFSEAASPSSPLRQTHDPDDYLLQGNEFYQRGDYPKAIKAYGECIDLAPDGVEPYFLRGNAKHLLGRYKEAIADFDEAIRLNPDDAAAYAAYHNRGNAKGKLGQYREAIDDYDEAVRLNPDDADAYGNRGISNVELKRYKEAIADFDEAVRLNPDDAAAYNNRGFSNAELKRYKEAIADFDEAIRLNPDDADAYSNRGEAKAALGQYRDAIADYDQAILLQPDCVGAYYNRGIAKGALGQYRGAIADCDQAILLQPDYAKAYNNRGKAKGALGQYKDAIADYDQAILLQPDYAKAYNNRGEAKQALGLKDEARKDLETALELAGKVDDSDLAARVERSLRELDADGDS